MSANTDALRKLYLDVAGEPTITERQEEEPSREPVGARESALEDELRSFSTETGLQDALEGLEMDA